MGMLPTHAPFGKCLVMRSYTGPISTSTIGWSKTIAGSSSATTRCVGSEARMVGEKCPPHFVASCVLSSDTSQSARQEAGKAIGHMLQMASPPTFSNDRPDSKTDSKTGRQQEIPVDP